MANLQNNPQNPSTANDNKPDSQDVAEREIYELFRAMFYAALLALIIRTFAFEPFNIPSGSMFPNLLVGDYLFVSKYSYGYSKYSLPLGIVDFEGRFWTGDRTPARGDVAVFRQPKNTDIDYIKRIIGLPGDKIQMKNGRLYINDEMVARVPIDMQTFEEAGQSFFFQKYLETLPGGVEHEILEISDDEQFDNTPDYIVPVGYYFAMGDNRDQSLDSRVTTQVGLVPAENLIGRASFLFFSIEPMAGRCTRDGYFKYAAEAFCALITVPRLIRYERLFKAIH